MTARTTASSILPWCRLTRIWSPTLNCRSSGFFGTGTRGMYLSRGTYLKSQHLTVERLGRAPTNKNGIRQARSVHRMPAESQAARRTLDSPPVPLRAANVFDAWQESKEPPDESAQNPLQTVLPHAQRPTTFSGTKPLREGVVAASRLTHTPCATFPPVPALKSTRQPPSGHRVRQQAAR